jgi:AcrR family transcriptional regulator
VAAEAGVAAPSIYSQYPDVQAMLADVVRECWRQLGEALVSDSTDTVELSPRDLLQARMAAYVRYAMERPSRYQLLFAPPVDTARFPDLPGLLQPAYRAIYFPVAALLEQGCTLPVKDPEAATLMIISMAHGRIAVAHLAPKRAGNSILGVQQFVATTLDRLLAQ